MGPVEQALHYVQARSIGAPVPPRYRVTMNFHPDTMVGGQTTIALLSQSGEYRSQFETGISNGLVATEPGGARWLWESRMFGRAYDACDGRQALLRPKYGALNFHSDAVGGSRRFGSCHLRLRPDVLARTTFCYPDSFMNPEHFGTADRMALVDLALRNPFSLDLLDNYVEAHVHGPVRLASDVEAVVIDPCYNGTPVEEAARSLQCPIEWHSGFRLPMERLAECERYRGARAAQAVSAVARGGVITALDIGRARLAGMDRQLTKWAWHCVARFGSEAPPVPVIRDRASSIR